MSDAVVITLIIVGGIVFLAVLSAVQNVLKARWSSRQASRKSNRIEL